METVENTLISMKLPSPITTYPTFVNMTIILK